MHLTKKKLETDNGVFGNTRETIQKDTVNRETSNDGCERERLTVTRGVPLWPVPAARGHSQGVALSKQANACTRVLRSFTSFSTVDDG